MANDLEDSEEADYRYDLDHSCFHDDSMGVRAAVDEEEEKNKEKSSSTTLVTSATSTISSSNNTSTARGCFITFSKDLKLVFPYAF